MQLDLFKPNETEDNSSWDTGSTSDDTTNEIIYRVCHGCGEEKPHTVDYFNIASSNTNGSVFLKGMCRSCTSKADRVRAKLRREHAEDNTGECYCCGKKQSELKTKLNLDHCHKTGVFRGYLCSPCNLGIGYLGDNEEGLQNALDYIRRFKDGQP